MSKGRTSRRRKKKVKPNGVEPEAEERNIVFRKWLKEKFGYKPSCLRIASCGDGGNGVFATKAILSGEAIISVPKRLMIGVHEVSCQSILVRSALTYLGKLEDEELRLTTVQILALFLVEEKRKLKDKHKRRDFGPYIEMLPQNFTHHLYWSEEELSCLSPKLFHKASIIRNRVVDQLHKLNVILLNMRSSSSEKTFCFDDVTWDEYIWAWCCVNTRCVFSCHQSNVKLKGLRKSDEDNYYLIPFLDMLNHHPQANVEAKYNKKTQHFEVITFSLCHKYDQLFIKYGEHGSLELLLEYGFVPFPDLSNLNDSVEVEFDDLCKVFQIDDESTKCALFETIIEKKLHLDLTFIHSGPSWSLSVCCILLANIQYKIFNKSPRQLLALICSGKRLHRSHHITHVIKLNLSELLMNMETEIRRSMLKSEEISSVQMLFLHNYYQIIVFILDNSRAVVLDSNESVFNQFLVPSVKV